MAKKKPSRKTAPVKKKSSRKTAPVRGKTKRKKPRPSRGQATVPKQKKAAQATGMTSGGRKMVQKRIGIRIMNRIIEVCENPNPNMQSWSQMSPGDKNYRLDKTYEELRALGAGEHTIDVPAPPELPGVHKIRKDET